MPWFHNYSAVGNSLGLTATVAALPIFLFWALAYKRMKGYLAASLTLLLMLLVVVVAYGMPVRAAYPQPCLEWQVAFGRLVGSFSRRSSSTT